MNPLYYNSACYTQSDNIQVGVDANCFGMNFSNTSEEKLLSIIPNPNLIIVETVVYTIASLLLEAVAVLSNAFLIASLVKKSPVTLTNHLLIELCLAELVKSCLYFVIYTISMPANSWMLGSTMCKILPQLLHGHHAYSIIILTVLSRNRYLAIVEPMKISEKKKSKTYAMVFLLYAVIISGSVSDGFKRNRLDYNNGAYRCVENLFLISPVRYGIILTNFAVPVISYILQIYYFLRIAYALWKNSKQLGENKLESSQRLKRNKKAVKTVFIMVLVYDVVVAPTTVMKSLALYYNNLTAFREYSNILLLIYCSFNSTFYIWRDKRLRENVKRFLARLFCKR